MDDMKLRTYTPISEPECLPLGHALKDSGKTWHLHVLPPGCSFNPLSDFSLVIEDDTDGQTYLSESKEFPMVDIELVQLLYGDAIVDPNVETIESDVVVTSPLLEKTRAISIAGGEWHHHIYFPDCVINPTPGKWTISIEHNNNVEFESWDYDPVDLLHNFEVLYFETQLH